MTVHIGKRFEMASSAAVITSIVIMALETFSLPEAALELLFAADIALSLLFLLEYLFRLATAENKRRYATSFYGVIDLIAIFPIVFHAAASVRVLRLLRLLRILRLLKLQRYSDALDRYIQALKLVAAEAAIFTGVALVFIVSFSFLIYEVEHARQPDKYRQYLRCHLVGGDFADLGRLWRFVSDYDRGTPADAADGADRHGHCGGADGAAGLRLEPRPPAIRQPGLRRAYALSKCLLGVLFSLAVLGAKHFCNVCAGKTTSAIRRKPCVTAPASRRCLPRARILRYAVSEDKPES